MSGPLVLAAFALTAQVAVPDAAAPAPVETPTGALDACHALLDARDFDKAEDCYRVATVLDGEDGRMARALLELLATRRGPAHDPVASTHTPVPTNARARGGARAPLSADAGLADVAQQRFDDGTAERVVQGAVLGGGSGFLATAAVLAAKRTDRADALPWIIAGPVIGGAAGAVGAWVLIDQLHPDAGDAALVTSATLMGSLAAFALEPSVFGGNTNVRAIPFEFLFALGGGALGATSAAVAGAFFEVTVGDVAFANSAALWGGVLMAVACTISNSRDFSTSALLIDAGFVVPYLVVLAAHEHVELNRFSTWLLDAGGLGGLLVGAAVISLTPSPQPSATVLLTTSLGLAGGLAATLWADSILDEAPP